jgi:hypothetical protein
MTNNTVDPWLETLTAGGGIEGVHLKYAKGIWYLDGVQISVGEIGLKIAVLMSTAAHNAVLWDNQEIIERTPLRRYEDAAPSFDIEKGWSPYTQFLGVGADEKHLGQLVTYTSSAWSGRHARPVPAEGQTRISDRNARLKAAPPRPEREHRSDVRRRRLGAAR